jgi:hypothetical protein
MYNIRFKCYITLNYYYHNSILVHIESLRLL